MTDAEEVPEAPPEPVWNEDEARERQVRRWITQAAQHHRRALRARIGSNERVKQLEEFRAIIRVAFHAAGEAGLDPGLFPKWAMEVYYGKRQVSASEAARLHGRPYLRADG